MKRKVFSATSNEIEKSGVHFLDLEQILLLHQAVEQFGNSLSPPRRGTICGQATIVVKLVVHLRFSLKQHVRSSNKGTLE